MSKNIIFYSLIDLHMGNIIQITKYEKTDFNRKVCSSDVDIGSGSKLDKKIQRVYLFFLDAVFAFKDIIRLHVEPWRKEVSDRKCVNPINHDTTGFTINNIDEMKNERSN